MRRTLLGLVLLCAAVVTAVALYRQNSGPVIIRPSGTVVRVYCHQTQEVRAMPLEEYLVGVVAAEMPAEFPVEALKAQAVVARTYILKRLMGGGVVNRVHPEADICDDPRHGQAWLSREELRARWGRTGYYRYYYKVKEAVDATRGVIVTYNGQPIDPVYHGSCGGATENARDVWKVDVPYLRSVKCPYDSHPRDGEPVTFTLTELDHRLGTDLGALPAVAGRQERFAVVARTETGRPRSMRLGSRVVPATELRERLELRSTNFRVQMEGNRVTFTCTGYGHGVGMCQYGARGLAEHGHDYRTILKHYYTGVEVTRLKDW
ncbi:MAG: stage II sporulation protein D [Desulfotomaculales bacterium]